MLINVKKNLFYIIILLLLSLAAVWPFFKPGFFSFHDNTQVVRVQQMAEALRDGQLPVRWVRDLGYGYGYPIFNFYAPLPYYFAGLLVLLGCSSIVAVKLMMAVPLVLSGVAMFFWAKSNWGRLGGLVAGLFYVYAPYKAADCYVRGAVGELWAMMFLPLVFLGLQSLFNQSKARPVLLAVALAGVILSHNILALLTALVLVIILLVAFFLRLLATRKQLIRLLFAIALALGLSAFFWLPAITEASLTKVQTLSQGANHYSQHFVYLDQLWNSLWGFAGSAPGRLDGMSFKIGKLHLLAALAGLGLLWFKKNLKRLKKQTFVLAILPLVISVVMMLQISQPVWELVSPLVFVQYPWRFLVFTILTASFLTGAVFVPQPTKQYTWLKWTVAAGLIVGLLFLNLKFFKAQAHFQAQSEDYTNRENIIWETSKISDEYLPKNFKVPDEISAIKQDLVVADKPDTKIEILSHKSNLINIKVNSPGSAELTVYLTYFPDWQVFLDQQFHSFKTKDGFIVIYVPEGEHLVTLQLKDSSIRKLANKISLFSLAVLFGVKYW
ncbi:YfhO family protein [Patescibacteria group bacterium]|nr:YfhO family protein [Patescibacteria group bacterium]